MVPAESAQVGHDALHTFRPARVGGGVVILTRASSMTVKVVERSRQIGTILQFPVKVGFFFLFCETPAPLADIDGNYLGITNRFLFLWSTIIKGLLFWYWMVLANFAHISH